MAAYATDNIMDNGLNHLVNNATDIILCEGQPASYSDATTLKSGGGNKLGAKGSAPSITLADGDTSGRKATVAQETGVSVSESGTVDHIAIVDDNNTELLLVAQLSSGQSVSSGGSATINSFDEEIADAS